MFPHESNIFDILEQKVEGKARGGGDKCVIEPDWHDVAVRLQRGGGSWQVDRHAEGGGGSEYR